MLRPADSRPAAAVPVRRSLDGVSCPHTTLDALTSSTHRCCTCAAVLTDADVIQAISTEGRASLGTIRVELFLGLGAAYFKRPN
jgi:hypothetical protein